MGATRLPDEPTGFPHARTFPAVYRLTSAAVPPLPAK
jgi:hypothetical protein